MYYDYIRECPCSDETLMGVFKDGGAWCLPLWKDSRGKNIHMHRHTRCCAQSLSHVWLFATPWTVARQAPLSMGFSRQEYCSGWPCPPPGDLPGPGIQPASPKPPALAAGSLPPAAPGKPRHTYGEQIIKRCQNTNSCWIWVEGTWKFFILLSLLPYNVEVIPKLKATKITTKGRNVTALLS